MAIKTVKCPKCDSETAVIKDENGKVFCPFCGEEIVDIPEIKEGEQFEYSDVPERHKENRAGGRGNRPFLRAVGRGGGKRPRNLGKA